MKTLLITLGTVVALFAGSTLFTSCGGNTSTEADSTEKHEMAPAIFSCSMHPEITGKEGDKCSKCGMALTASNGEDHEMSNMDISAKAKCPMHPEEMGKEGDKCSKCGMALVFNDSDKHTHKD
ncbi:MAG: hypothetical protein L3J29_10945 [Cyclobacteriaceae bacterium]|nr:hypothetical protein [Cyclobacteriaceae bacterium]